jgi:sulfur relay (sulfurtransferase) DsrC/TusE family protein
MRTRAIRPQAQRDDCRDYLYELFLHPLNPVAELCKLAGLPKPCEDVY